MLLAHGHTVALYRGKYQPKFGGQIGISLCGTWPVPWDDSEESRLFSSTCFDNRHSRGKGQVGLQLWVVRFAYLPHWRLSRVDEEVLQT